MPNLFVCSQRQCHNSNSEGGYLFFVSVGKFLVEALQKFSCVLCIQWYKSHSKSEDRRVSFRFAQPHCVTMPVRNDVIVRPKVFLGHVECCLLLYEKPY